METTKRMTEETRQEIIRLANDGTPNVRIAERFGVNRSTISRIVSNELKDKDETSKEDMAKKASEGREESDGQDGQGQQEQQEQQETQEAEPVAEEKSGSDDASLILPDFMKLVGRAVESKVKDITDKSLEEKVENAAKKIAQGMRPIQMKFGDVKVKEVTGLRHKELEECVSICHTEKQLYMAGDAGTGKTTIAQHVAEAMDLNFGYISCSAGLSEAHVLGRMLFDGQYVEAPFINVFENGGVFLFDEIDAADSNMLLVINSALANGKLSVPNRKDKPYAERHENFVCIVAGNTWGSGGFDYHGRNHLDAAFLDRFAASKCHVDYDIQLESKLVDPKIAKAMQGIRDNLNKFSVRKLVSTRAIVSIDRQVSSGLTFKKAMSRFVIGWSKEEISKAGIDQVVHSFGNKTETKSADEMVKEMEGAI